MARNKKPKNETKENIFNLPDELETNSSGEIEYAIYLENENSIYIRYDKIFKDDTLAPYCNYDIGKRKYYKILDFIKNDINLLLNSNDSVAEKYLMNLFTMKYKVSTTDSVNDYKEENFIKDMENIFKDKLIYNFIDSYIEDTYTISLDKAIEENKENKSSNKIIPDLQVTDETNKILLKSAMMIRLCIPSVCDYSNKYKNNKIINKIFSNIIVHFSNGSNKVLNKLAVIVRSRISVTTFSNQVIWNFLTNLHMDKDIVAVRFYNNLIEAILCKIEKNKSAIKFLDVVLRQKVTYIFTFNYPMKFKSLKTYQDEDMDEKDRVEMQYFINNKSEIELYTRQLDIAKACYRIKDKYKDEISKFKENLKNERVNEIQKHIMDLYYYDDLNINLANEDEKMILLYNIYRDFKKKGYEQISKSNKFFQINKNYSQILDILMKDNPIARYIDLKNYSYLDENDNEVNIDGKAYNDEMLSLILEI